MYGFKYEENLECLLKNGHGYSDIVIALFGNLSKILIVFHIHHI